MDSTGRNAVKIRNRSAGSIASNALLAAFGLFLFGVGTYLTIQANIGVAPWDTFYLGVNKVTKIQYGTISIATSFTIIAIDLLLKEKIGIGTFLDAIIVGKTVDLMNWLDLVPECQSLLHGAVVMIVGLTIMGFSQYIYMKAGLCCGPRDALLVALGKRVKKVPIGIVSTLILLTVFCLGFLLGGSIGIGTIIAVCLQGNLMQLAFRIMHFDPTAVQHQDLIESAKVLTRK